MAVSDSEKINLASLVQRGKSSEVAPRRTENSGDQVFRPLGIEEGEAEPVSSTSPAPQPGGLRREDSFWRWMSEEMGEVCDVPSIADDTGDCWDAVDGRHTAGDGSTSSLEFQLDLGSLGPSLSQHQSFSILDFSPDWAYAGSETKVLICGKFLGEAQFHDVRWSCMFGEVEVPADPIAGHVLGCRAPPLPPGRVPFYVSRSDRLACSEIREFEFRDKSLDSPPSSARIGRASDEEEAELGMRLSRILFVGSEVTGGRSWTGRGVDAEETTSRLRTGLREWVSTRARGEDEGPKPDELDRGGLGVIHLAAALGYEWAMKPLVSAGANPCFRDRHGWSALHWAAYFGREETVVTLIGLGSYPGALADPTQEYPQGRTPADVASSRGHKGIAGFLAEADLTGQLSRLNLRGGVVGCAGAGAEEPTLAAVRTAALAAARVQFALLSRVVPRLARGGLAVVGPGFVTDPAPRKYSRRAIRQSEPSSAATRIQRKYRGWRGRRAFLGIRDRIVRIQAHVRGHQARRQYRRWVWSVGVVEKAILRWRRRGRGLRGFRARHVGEAAQWEEGEEDAFEFLRQGQQEKAAAAERALTRVLSMARLPEGRRQYLTMVSTWSQPSL